MLVVGILLIVAVIAWIDLPRLWRKKQKKDLSVYLILLLIGTGFSIAEGLNWGYSQSDGLAHLCIQAGGRMDFPSAVVKV